MTVVLLSLGVLVAGMVLSLVLARAPRVGLCVAMSAIVIAGLLCIGAALATLVGGGSVHGMVACWALPLGGEARMQLDGLSAWFLLAISILSLAVAIYSTGYMQDEMAQGSVPVFSALLCLLVGAMVVTVCAADAMLFLVAWEVMSLSGFFLVSFQDRRPEVRQGAWIYLIATHIGTAVCLLPMFGLLAAQAGGTGFAGFAGAMKAADPRLAMGLFVLGVIGFGTKAGFMPMHVWLPKAHPVAPSPVSALLSGVVIKTGIYGLIRLLGWLPPLPMQCAVLLIAIGAVGGIMGILYALSQRQLKRMLAYSSVENIGIIALGLGIGMLGRAMDRPVIAELGFAGAILHVLNHSLFKGLLFLSAGAVLHGTGTGDIERLGGLAKKTPVNAGLFLVAAAAICALPPLNGFVSEWLIYNAMFRAAGSASGHVTEAVVAVVGLTALALIGGLALASFAKVFAVVFLGEPRDRHVHPHPTPKPMLWGMMVPAAGCAVVGLMPWLIWPLLQSALRSAGVATPTVSGEATTVLQTLAAVSGIFGLLVAVAAGLLIFRIKGTRGYRAAGTGPTWGCGYPYASPRIQYTGSSFGWSLMSSFAAVLRTKKRVQRPEGPFPQAGRAASETPDVSLTRAFEPAFAAIAWVCERLRPLQRGSIHLYLVYMVATLIVVFAIEALVSHKPARPSSAPEKSEQVVRAEEK